MQSEVIVHFILQIMYMYSQPIEILADIVRYYEILLKALLIFYIM